MDEQEHVDNETDAGDGGSPWSFSKDVEPDAPAAAPPPPPGIRPRPAPPSYGAGTPGTPPPAPTFGVRAPGAMQPPAPRPFGTSPAATAQPGAQPAPQTGGVGAQTIAPPPPPPPPPPPNPAAGWGSPTQTPGAFDAGIWGPPPGTPIKAWYKRPSRVIPLGILAILGLFLAVGVVLSLQTPERIKAQPAAPTPAGFQVVTAPEYTFAVPDAWNTKVLDDAAKDELTENLRSVAPSAGEKLEDAQNQDVLEGTQTIAGDPANGDNVTLIPYKALDGDPRKANELGEIQEGFSAEKTGLDIASINTEPADVHGFPAAKVTLTANVAGQQATIISWIIQTGDKVYQLTVTSMSPERATALSDQIVPTFEPT